MFFGVCRSRYGLGQNLGLKWSLCGDKDPARWTIEELARPLAIDGGGTEGVGGVCEWLHARWPKRMEMGG